MGSASSVALQIATDPAYEFVISLCVWSDVDERPSFDIGPDWFAAIRAQAPRALLEAISQFARESDMVWAHLLTFIPESHVSPEVPAFVDLVEQQDPVEVHLRLVGGGVRYCERATSAEIMRAAVAGDRIARREFLRTSYPDDARWQAALRHLLAQPSRALHVTLVEILRGWYDAVFRVQERALMEPIACDAANRRAQLTRDPPLVVVRGATNGFEYVPEEGIRRIVLVPSLLVRPQLYLLDHEEIKWICVPVADECLATDPLKPPPRLVRLLRALGEERRLGILRALAAESFSLGELAARLGMGKTLLHHHLTVLRGAGLILVRNGNPTLYSLRYDTLAQVGPLLDTFLAPPPRKEFPDAADVSHVTDHAAGSGGALS
jgi:DNA-binding transcriptional ArsR family regulator